jgi:hypothetical protein
MSQGSRSKIAIVRKEITITIDHLWIATIRLWYASVNYLHLMVCPVRGTLTPCRFEVATGSQEWRVP